MYLYRGQLVVALAQLQFPSIISSLARLERLDELGWRLLPVPLGVVLDPAPQVGAGVLERELRLPAQLLVGERRIGRQVQHVSLPALDDLVGEVAPDDVAKGLDHLKDGAAAAGTQVPRLDAGLVLA